MSAAAEVSGVSPPGWWRFRSWPGRVFDVGVVLALLAIGAVIALIPTNEVPRLNPARLPIYIIVLLPLGSLLVRRRHPEITIGVILAGLVASTVLREPRLIEPLVLVAVYIAAVRLPWRVALGIAAGAYLVFVIATIISEPVELPPPSALATAASDFIPIAAAYVVGVYVGTRVAYIDALQARASQLARERELLAERAVAQERVRIARELHDVVAHHLSLIAVQAGALSTQVEAGSPAAATAATIASTGHTAMDEMRRMLGVLRLGVGGDQALDRAPQPGLDGIGGLVAQTRAAGVETELHIEGNPRTLSAGVELSAYRIVQEALTNVLRHAGPARCNVHIAYGDRSLEIAVTDDGRGAVSNGVATGHGLVGMRERVAMLGGQLSAGPAQGGGFAVRATLPLPGQNAHL